MAVALKPHTISVYAPLEGEDTGDGVEVTQWKGAPTSVPGMVQPMTTATAYRDYALECQRPLRLFADVDKETLFPLGAVFSWNATVGTKWGRVIAPVISEDAEPETSHIVVLAEVWSPAGTVLE